MADIPTVSDLFRAKVIGEEEIDAAVTACVAGTAKEPFVFADVYEVDLASAVAAIPRAHERLHDPEASEFLKRIAIRTAIMLARPEKRWIA
ncbi:hypothetical protein [Methylobacterium durans]|uniref:Uncharacterized protein n=1 Tax=Methylobacterium durans TaxID=2202825 RepID=A0A2U8W1Z9_9HYPH|nr:hypothetical protein [Methylobacterium durans]AWN40105.1 hypothetical protein DK389_05585 [Methylobacterium durans]